MTQIKLPENDKAIDRHVGMRLRLLRLHAKMSQTELADKLELTFQQIQKYERGANRIDASRLWQICEVFAAEPNFFFAGLGNDILKNEKAATFSKQNHKLLNSFDNIGDWSAKDAIIKLCEAFSINCVK